MAFDLEYGAIQRASLNLESVNVIDFTALPGEPLDDPSAAVAAAVSDPIDFPPLASAVVPGDRVAIALDSDLPCVDQLVAGILHILKQSGVESHDVVVLHPQGGHPCEETDQWQGAQQLVHDPTDTEQLAYLATTAAGEAIYFNRQLVDADVVIPISLARPAETLGYAGVNGGLFPLFADAATQERIRLTLLDTARDQDQDVESANEAAWLLGVQFAVQVIPGTGESIMAILAGDQREVQLRGQEMVETLWQRDIPGPVPLVIGSLAGRPSDQNWEQVARAIDGLHQAVEDQGALVICTELAERPGPALQLLSGWDSMDTSSEQLVQASAADGLAAALLLSVRERIRVYLWSQLPETDVEELGLGAITSPDEIERLARDQPTCVIVGNANRTSLRLHEKARAEV